jgi:hypothetical protein
VVLRLDALGWFVDGLLMVVCKVDWIDDAKSKVKNKVGGSFAWTRRFNAGGPTRLVGGQLCILDHLSSLGDPSRTIALVLLKRHYGSELSSVK